MTLLPRLGAGLLALLFATLLLAVAGDAHAQSSVMANVTVLEVPTSGAGVRSMNFGTVAPGATSSRTITAAADSNATGIGHFSFSGINGNRDVQLTFGFPASLTRVGGGATMPVSFNGDFGLHCFDRNSGVHACTLFNPSPGGANPSIIVITPPAPPRSGVLRIYLGGSVSPPASQAAGTYQGTVTLTMARL